jgi:hypothetical protein
VACLALRLLTWPTPRLRRTSVPANKIARFRPLPTADGTTKSALAELSNPFRVAMPIMIVTTLVATIDAMASQ